MIQLSPNSFYNTILDTLYSSSKDQRALFISLVNTVSTNSDYATTVQFLLTLQFIHFCLSFFSGLPVSKPLELVTHYITEGMYMHVIEYLIKLQGVQKMSPCFNKFQQHGYKFFQDSLYQWII